MIYIIRKIGYVIFLTLPYLIVYINFISKRWGKSNKNKFLELLALECSVVVPFYFISFYNENLASIAVYIVPIYFIYRNLKKIVPSIIIEVFMCIIIVLCDSVVGFIYIYLMHGNIISGTSEYYILCSVILVVIYFVSRFAAYLIYKYKDMIEFNYRSKYAILIYAALFITVILFYVNINWNTSSEPMYLTKVNSILFIIFGIVLVVVCALVFNLIKKEVHFYYNNMYIENLKQYTKNLEDVYMDMRKFRHDYINILAAINGFIDDNDLEGLKKYFNDYIYPLNDSLKMNNFKLGKLQNIKISEIKGLIATKLLKAQELGIDVNIEIVDPVEEINMETVDLIRSLGILLDNATEAAMDSEEKKLTLALIVKNTSITIIVENSFKHNGESISTLFREGYSTKGDNRGIGLSNLKNFVDKHKNVLLETAIDGNIFTQVLTIAKDKTSMGI